MSDPASPPQISERIQILRSIQHHQVQLSATADQKASILIAASFIVLTIIFGQMEATNPSLTLFVLGVFTFTSAILATLAVMPRCRPQPGRTHRMNLFFFGTFAQLSEREFSEAVMELLEDERNSVEAVIRDIYQQGTDLFLKKHRYLAWSYRALLAGFACAGVASFFQFALS